MKKYIALFLALIMSLSLCACGSTTTNSTQKDPETFTTSDKATDENGTLNAPSVNSEKNRKDTTDYGDPADLSKPNEVIDCFKKTPVASEDSSNLGFAMVNTGVYTDDTIPTYDSVISNMITDAKYSYDAENQTVKITGDMDAASMRVMFRYLGISDSNSPDDFGGYDPEYTEKQSREYEQCEKHEQQRGEPWTPSVPVDEPVLQRTEHDVERNGPEEGTYYEGELPEHDYSHQYQYRQEEELPEKQVVLADGVVEFCHKRKFCV